MAPGRIIIAAMLDVAMRPPCRRRCTLRAYAARRMRARRPQHDKVIARKLAG